MGDAVIVTGVGATVRRVLALAAGAVLLAACAREVPGTARPAEALGPPPVTTAAPPTGVVPPPALGPGTSLEAHRIAGVTSLLQVLFPDRTDNCYPSGPFVDAASLEQALFVPGTAAPVLQRYGFVTSWAQCNQTLGNQDAGAVGTVVAVMELSDPASAAAAADELAAAAQDGSQREARLSASGVPALVGPSAAGETVQAWATSGRMLAYVFHDGPAGQGEAGASRVVDDQLALLAGFAPTPQAQVPALPADPTGLAGRVLDLPGSPQPLTGPFDLPAYLRIAIDPTRENEVLTANGFTGSYLKASDDDPLTLTAVVYAFPSSAQTNAAYTAFSDLETTAFGGTPFRLPSIPDAPCFVFDSGTPGAPYYYQRCYVGFGQYLVNLDVGGVATPDDTSVMNELLPAQRDLIRG